MFNNLLRYNIAIIITRIGDYVTNNRVDTCQVLTTQSTKQHKHNLEMATTGCANTGAPVFRDISKRSNPISRWGTKTIDGYLDVHLGL